MTTTKIYASLNDLTKQPCNAPQMSRKKITNFAQK